ncbi:hypothetical protein DMENIID0001_055590 [Sergentomyia squamirostris]
MYFRISVSGRCLQCFCTLLMSLSYAVHGIFTSWPAQTLPKLLSSDSPLPSGSITELESSYIVSLTYVGGLIGSLVIGSLPIRYGRKWPLIAMNVISVVSCFLILFATNIYYILISRFLCGISFGGYRIILPTYVSEICEKQIRGAFILLSLVFYSLGVTSGSIICEYFDFYTVPYFSLAVLLLSFLLILFPDSPQTLIMRKSELAEKSIRFYRRNVPEEKILEEFREMKQSDSGERVTLQDFHSRAAVKALIIVTVLISGRNFSGIQTIIAYAGIILSKTETSVDVNQIISWFFAIQLFSSIATTFTVDTLGRRSTLIFGLVGNAIFLVIFGFCFCAQEKVEDWILITSFFGIAATGSILINLPAVIYPEILPVKLRNIVGGVIITLQMVEGIFLVQFYQPAANAFGTHSFWTLLLDLSLYFDFYTVPYFPLALLLLSFLLILFPDSPQTLMMRNSELVEKSIRFYRRNVPEEKILEEFREMNQSDSGERVTLQDFRSRAVVKSLIIVIFLISGRNFSGIQTIIAYAGIILSKTETSVDVNQIISWFFTIQLFSSIATTFTVDTLGRRSTLIFGLVGNAIFLVIFGFCFCAQEKVEDWILITSFFGIAATGSILINLPAVIYSELLPVKLRNIVGGVIITLQMVEGIFLVQFYQPAANAFGTHSCMFAFAIWNVASVILMAILLPETKKKSLNEILENLDKKH